jgi:tRNA(adenine34) deaminase
MRFIGYYVSLEIGLYSAKYSQNEEKGLPLLDSELIAELHQHFMEQAFRQAQAAFDADEVPVGAVIEHNGQIIAAAHNQCIALKDATAHAEMLAITQAAEAIGDWRLENCTLYVTLEPCIMCCGAILNSRIPYVVYGATDPKGGGAESMYQLLSDKRLNHRSHVLSGVMSPKCGKILTSFFKHKRAMGKK